MRFWGLAPVDHEGSGKQTLILVTYSALGEVTPSSSNDLLFLDSSFNNTLGLIFSSGFFITRAGLGTFLGSSLSILAPFIGDSIFSGFILGPSDASLFFNKLKLLDVPVPVFWNNSCQIKAVETWEYDM